jgi:hypothetical protein
METHPDPANAKSDGPNAWPLDRMESLLTTLVELDRLVKERGFEEDREAPRARQVGRLERRADALEQPVAPELAPREIPGVEVAGEVGANQMPT